MKSLFSLISLALLSCHDGCTIGPEMQAYPLDNKQGVRVTDKFNSVECVKTEVNEVPCIICTGQCSAISCKW